MEKNDYLTSPKTEKWLNSFRKSEFILRGYNAQDFDYKAKFEILTLDQKFVEQVDRIRGLYNIPKSGFQDNELLIWVKQLLNDKKSFINYKTAISRLLNENNIAKRWRPCLEYFVIYNKTDIDHIIPQPVDTLIIGEDKNAELHLVIYKDTTIKDLKTAWPRIIKDQELLNPFLRKITNPKAYTTIICKKGKKGRRVPLWSPKRIAKKDLTVYKQIVELKRKGKTSLEISEIVFNNRTDSPKVASYYSKFKRIAAENELY